MKKKLIIITMACIFIFSACSANVEQEQEQVSSNSFQDVSSVQQNIQENTPQTYINSTAEAPTLEKYILTRLNDPDTKLLQEHYLMQAEFLYNTISSYALNVDSLTHETSIDYRKLLIALASIEDEYNLYYKKFDTDENGDKVLKKESCEWIIYELFGRTDFIFEHAFGINEEFIIDYDLRQSDIVKENSAKEIDGNTYVVSVDLYKNSPIAMANSVESAILNVQEVYGTYKITFDPMTADMQVFLSVAKIEYVEPEELTAEEKREYIAEQLAYNNVMHAKVLEYIPTLQELGANYTVEDNETGKVYKILDTKFYKPIISTGYRDYEVQVGSSVIIYYDDMLKDTDEIILQPVNIITDIVHVGYNKHLEELVQEDIYVIKETFNALEDDEIMMPAEAIKQFLDSPYDGMNNKKKEYMTHNGYDFENLKTYRKPNGDYFYANDKVIVEISSLRYNPWTSDNVEDRLYDTLSYWVFSYGYDGKFLNAHLISFGG